MTIKASIIIRTKNESCFLERVLESLANQSEQDFEVILVDSGSTDKTLEIAKSFQDKMRINIYAIRPDQFSYPFACNFGAEKASAPHLIYLSGHSVPVGQSWISSALSDIKDEKIAGVYGPVYPLGNASVWEKIIYFPNSKRTNKRIIIQARMGVLGNTNALIRKDLWEQYHFDKKNYWDGGEDGGEDGDWASHFLGLGYKIIFEPKFAVRHSHGLGLFGFIKQYAHWRDLAKRFKRP